MRRFGLRLVKGTTEYSKYDDIEIYVNDERLDKVWLVADEEAGIVICLFEDSFCDILPVLIDGQPITYTIHGKVKIDAWKLQCGICGG